MTEEEIRRRLHEYARSVDLAVSSGWDLPDVVFRSEDMQAFRQHQQDSLQCLRRLVLASRAREGTEEEVTG